MRLANSVATSMMFPKSRQDLDEFRRVASFLAGKGMDCLEFYLDGPARDGFGPILADNGLSGVYIAVIPSKEGKKFLCALDPDARAEAVRLHCEWMDIAMANGVPEYMICSGGLENDIPKQMDVLADSIARLYDYAGKKNYPLQLLLEPCDDNMQAYNLLGPYERVVELTRRVNEQGLPMKLTMDCAHSSEVGEDFVEAVEATRPWCNHIHFANCNVSQPDNPLYGDKHLGFEYPDSEWTPATLDKLTRRLEEIYPGDEPLRIGVEILCREDEPFAYFEKTWNLVPFLHKENRA